MSKKIVDLTEYKDNQEDIEMMAEDIPDEVLEAYIKEVENSTPDLWSKIEIGYEKELMSIDNERKLRKKKTIGIIAAAALITLIAVPVAILSNFNSKENKSDSSIISTVSDKDDAVYYDYAADEMPEFADSDDYERFDESAAEETDSENEAGLNQNSIAADASGQSQDNDYVNGAEYSSDDELSVDEKAVDEGLFAEEIEVNGVVYEMSDAGLTEEIPDGYINEIQLDNTYCDYPDDTLYIYQTQDNDAFIYVAYYDKYKLYIKKTENILKK